MGLYSLENAHASHLPQSFHKPMKQEEYEVSHQCYELVGCTVLPWAATQVDESGLG